MIMCSPHCSKEWPFWHEGFADFSVINEDSPELHFILPFIILATHSSFNSVSIKLWPAFVSVLISLSRFLFISSSPVVIPTLYLNFFNLILFLSKIQTLSLCPIYTRQDFSLRETSFQKTEHDFVALRSVIFLSVFNHCSCYCLVNPNHVVPRLWSQLLSANHFLLLASFHSVFQCLISVHLSNQSQSLPVVLFSLFVYKSTCTRLVVLISLDLQLYEFVFRLKED